MSEPALTDEEVYVLLEANSSWAKSGRATYWLVREAERLTRERVEERMKELVCENCGEGEEIAFDERIAEGWCGKCDNPILGVARAEYESRMERERGE